MACTKPSAGKGVRNSHLISIAPTGTLSLLANNISSGIEPVFSLRHRRTLRTGTGDLVCVELEDYAFRLWRSGDGDPQRLPPAFVEAMSLPPLDHLAMQAALQPYVDNAISKTINVPPELPLEAFRSLYERAYDAGLKGCTASRPNPVIGGVLRASQPLAEAGCHCCVLDRESD